MTKTTQTLIPRPPQNVVWVIKSECVLTCTDLSTCDLITQIGFLYQVKMGLLCLGQPVFPEAWSHSPLLDASTHNLLEHFIVLKKKTHLRETHLIYNRNGKMFMELGAHWYERIWVRALRENQTWQTMSIWCNRCLLRNTTMHVWWTSFKALQLCDLLIA